MELTIKSAETVGREIQELNLDTIVIISPTWTGISGRSVSI